MSSTLNHLGIALEIVGVFLLALDFVAAPLKQVLGEVLTKARRYWYRAIRAVRDAIHRLRNRGRVIQTITAGGAVAGGIAPQDVVGLAKIPGVESPELLAWLRERALVTEDRIHELYMWSNRDRVAHEKALAVATSELRAEIVAAVAKSEGAYQPWRIFGLALAVLGIILTQTA